VRSKNLLVRKVKWMETQGPRWPHRNHAKTPVVVQKNMLTGSLKETGGSGVPGHFPYHGVTVREWDGPRWEPKEPLGFSSGFGRCGCGRRLYRKHRIVSLLLRVIDQALNTSTPFSDGPPVITSRMSISCDSCGESLEVDLAACNSTTELKVSLNIVPSTLYQDIN